MALLPQFLSSSDPVVPQLWILSIMFVVLATLNAALYGVFANRAGSYYYPAKRNVCSILVAAVYLPLQVVGH